MTFAPGGGLTAPAELQHDWSSAGLRRSVMRCMNLSKSIFNYLANIAERQGIHALSLDHLGLLRLACFDMDGTLITPKGPKAKFPKDRHVRSYFKTALPFLHCNLSNPLVPICIDASACTT